jgi:hypothetical protein
MAAGAAVSRIVGAGRATIDRRKIQIFFQRFPGTNARSGIQGLDFTVTVDGGPPRIGSTPADGKVEIRLAAGETATLEILGSQYQVTLLTGGLHPIAELRGVQQRLNMLGYNAGALEAPAVGVAAVLANTGQNQTASTEHAIIDFQSDNNPLLIDSVAGGRTQPRIQQVVRSAGGE